jgi:hypothetical protein
MKVFFRGIVMSMQYFAFTRFARFFGQGAAR